MLENYIIYAKDVMDYLTERGYRLGYTGIVDDVIDKGIAYFYFKERSVFKLIVNNLFIEQIANCNSEIQLSSSEYPQGALLTKLDVEVQAVSNELQPASIFFTFNHVLFSEFDNAIDKCSAFFTGYREFASFAALFEDELEAMEPVSTPMTKVKMFDVYQRGNRLFYISGAAGAAYKLTTVFGDMENYSEIVEIHELIDGLNWERSVLPSSGCVKGVIDFLAFAFNKNVIKMALGDSCDESAFSGLPVTPVEISQLALVKIKREFGEIRIEIPESQENVLNIHVNNLSSYCSWNSGTDSDYRNESYNACINEVVHHLTKNNGIQGFASGAALLITTVIRMLLPFLAQKPEILNYLVSVNNFYVGMAKGEHVELEEYE